MVRFERLENFTCRLVTKINLEGGQTEILLSPNLLVFGASKLSEVFQRSQRFAGVLIDLSIDWGLRASHPAWVV